MIIQAKQSVSIMKSVISIFILGLSSICMGSLSADFNCDGIVDFNDFATFSEQWLREEPCTDDYDYVSQYASPLGYAPIYVPENVGVLTFESDDLLITTWTVLYTECRKRGIPITLVVPGIWSMMIGGQFNLCTDEQVGRMVCDGGAELVYHSLSHWHWQDDLSWYKYETVMGCKYGTGPAIANHPECNFVESPIEDRIAAVLQQETFFESNGHGAELIRVKGFCPPGHWYGYDKVGSFDSRDERMVWTMQHYKAFFGFGCSARFQNIPAGRRQVRLTYTDLTQQQRLNLIDQLAGSNMVCHMYAHEWLDPNGHGSMSDGGAYSWNVSYGDLTELLDAMEEKIENGTLIVMSGSAACNVIRGKREWADKLVNGNHSIPYYGNPCGQPAGWSRLKADNTVWCPGHGGTLVWANSGGPDNGRYIVIDNDDSEYRPCWEQSLQLDTECRQWLLCGYAKKWDDVTGDAKITIGAVKPSLGSSAARTYPLYEFLLGGEEHGGGPLKDIPATGEWTYFQVPFAIPEPLLHISIKFHGEGSDARVGFAQLSIYPNGI